MRKLVERHWWALQAGWTEYRSEVRYLKHADPPPPITVRRWLRGDD